MTLLLAVAIAAWAAGDPAPDPAVLRHRAAALGQVELWWDLGELGKADALTRRAVKGDADVDWHLARLETLRRAGMEDWIDAEYVHRRLEGAAAEAWAIARWRADPRQPLPDTPAGAAERVRAALAAGDVAQARSVLPSVGDGARPALALQVAVAAGEVDAALALAEGLLADPDVDLAALAPLWRLPDSRKVRAARASALARVDEAVDGDDPAALIAPARLALAVQDEDRLARLADRLDALTHVDEGSIRTLHFDPDTLDDFDVPRRPRWTAPMLVSAARLEVPQADPELGWGREDEIDAMARELVRELDRVGRAEDADAARARWLGACEPNGDAMRLARTQRRSDARDRAEQDLWSCLGVLDLEPNADPAHVLVGDAVRRTALAWEAFAQVARELGYLREAALGTGVAARLAPSAARVAAARADTQRAAFEADDLGLPTVERLLIELDTAAWLKPAEALDGRRAARTAARTAALLSLEPERLLAAMTPEAACVPPLRSRCQVEAAVAEAAFERAHRVLPEGFHPATDPGARRAAARVLGMFEAERFGRVAALAGVTHTESRLAAVMDKPGLREGLRAGPWSAGAMTGASLLGRMVVIVLWDAKSAGGREELAAVDGLTQRWTADRLPVKAIAVNVDDEPTFLAAIAAAPLRHMTVARDPALRARFDVRALPTLVVIDAEGVVRAVQAGWDPGLAAGLDGVVRAFASRD